MISAMKPLPFPFELVFDCPALVTADALVKGATLSALYAFWRSDCEPLPEDDAGLSIAAKCHTAQWYRARGRVKKAINALLPALATVYAKRRKAAQGKQAIGRLGGFKRVENSKEKAQLTAGKGSLSNPDTQRAMRPPTQSTQAAEKKGPSPIERLSDRTPPALPMQPTRAPVKRKPFAARGAHRDKQAVWLHD